MDTSWLLFYLLGEPLEGKRKGWIQEDAWACIYIYIKEKEKKVYSIEALEIIFK